MQRENDFLNVFLETLLGLVRKECTNNSIYLTLKICTYLVKKKYWLFLAWIVAWYL